MAVGSLPKQTLDIEVKETCESLDAFQKCLDTHYEDPNRQLKLLVSLGVEISLRLELIYFQGYWRAEYKQFSEFCQAAFKMTEADILKIIEEFRKTPVRQPISQPIRLEDMEDTISAISSAI
jgi:hypothetical protein